MELVFDVKTNINVEGYLLLDIQYFICACLSIILQIFILFFGWGVGGWRGVLTVEVWV